MQLAALLFVTGSGPGLGKSTLARALAERLRLTGCRVVLFAEEDIETDPSFDCVMEEFRSSSRVELATLLRASSKYLDEIAKSAAEIVVFDALFAYLPSLLAWGYSDREIADFMQRMAELFAESPVLEIHLVGDLEAGLTRAGAREGGDWLHRHVLKVSTYEGAPQVSGIGEVAEYLGELERRAARLLLGAPWRVEFLDTDAGFSSVTSAALAIVDGLVDC